MVTSISDYENSESYRLINDMIEISAPLTKLGIAYFIYAELQEGHIKYLVNNDQAIREFINHQGLKHELALSPLKIINQQNYLVSNMDGSRSIKNYYERFFRSTHTTDEIVYIEDGEEIRKVYIFGIINPFGVNRDYLELFILYFNDKASCIIKKAQLILIPQEFIKDYADLSVIIKDFIMAEIEADFLTSINAKYYKIKYLQQKYLLSPRETQCLELILENKIAKEIAAYLHLTARTVETYIEHLKRKLDCRSKQEIMVKYFL